MSIFKRSPIILLPQVRPTCEGLIQCHTEWKSYITPEEDYSSVGNLSFGRNSSEGVFAHWKPMALYILSNNKEDIQDGDYVYVDCSQNITGYKGFGIWKYMKAPCPMPYWGNSMFCKKVIASTDKSLNLPEPSREFIRKYILAYNDKNTISHVLVEYYPEDEDWSELNGAFIIPETVKVSLDNTITIRKVKDSYTEAELINALKEFAKSIDTVDKQVHPEKYVWAWIEKNLINPF